MTNNLTVESIEINPLPPLTFRDFANSPVQRVVTYLYDNCRSVG